MRILEKSLVPPCAHILFVANAPCKEVRELQCGRHPHIEVNDPRDPGEKGKMLQYFSMDCAIANVTSERLSLVKVKVDVLRAQAIESPLHAIVDCLCCTDFVGASRNVRIVLPGLDELR